MRRRFWQIMMGVMAAALLVSGRAVADSLTVYVGYADNLRASGFFPTPWLGGANVVSQTPTGQSLDTGGVRIDNTGASSIAITNFKVTLNPGGGGIPFTIWSSLTIGAGKTGIFTQTGSYNFDSSDSGVFGGAPPANLEPNNADHNGNTNLIGGCSSPASFMTSAQLALCTANAPVISFNVNGGPTQTFTDTGQILNTGGWDFVNNGAFGEDGNESINWNTIGGTSRGGNATPEPGSVLLFGTGLLGLGVLLRKRFSQA